MTGTIAAALDDARQGRPIVLVGDDPARVGGELVVPAARAGAEAVNFMARHARGLIRLALNARRVGQLGLPTMPVRAGMAGADEFTVAIEARAGVSTGISAADRARTIAVAIDPATSGDDLASPGHVFPIVARDGGVLARAGIAEAAVDIARLAGFGPSGVACKILDDDGAVAGIDRLRQFARRHDLRLIHLADVVAHCRRRGRLVERIADATIDSHHGGAFRLLTYRHRYAAGQTIALVKGDVATDRPVPVHLHPFDIAADVLAGGSPLHAAMRRVADRSRGVVVIRFDGCEDDDIALQILHDLGLRRIEWPSRPPEPIHDRRTSS